MDLASYTELPNGCAAVADVMANTSLNQFMVQATGRASILYDSMHWH